MKVNDFCCGAGGMALGFIDAGFEIAGAWDVDRFAVASYRHNIGDHVQKADIGSLTKADIPKADVWTFGFPCQDISIAGQKAGMIEGTRSGLFFTIMRLLKSVEDRPQVIVAENVKMLKKYLPVIEAEYEAAGYRMYSKLLNSKYHGVPQSRERYFVVGVRNDIAGDFIFPDEVKTDIPALSSVLESFVDAKYYLAPHLVDKIFHMAAGRIRVREASASGYAYVGEGDAVNFRYPESTTRRGRVGKGIANTLTTTVEQGVIEVVANLRHYSQERSNRVYSPTGVSPTVTCITGSGQEIKILEEAQALFTTPVDEVAYPCVASYYKGISPSDIGNSKRTQIVEAPFKVRKLTPREYARLQGFPDSFEQIVSDSQFYKQMGNAVTTHTARFVAAEIRAFLGSDYHSDATGFFC